MNSIMNDPSLCSDACFQPFCITEIDLPIYCFFWHTLFSIPTNRNITLSKKNTYGYCPYQSNVKMIYPMLQKSLSQKLTFYLNSSLVYFCQIFLSSPEAAWSTLMTKSLATVVLLCTGRIVAILHCIVFVVRTQLHCFTYSNACDDFRRWLTVYCFICEPKEMVLFRC